MIPEPHRRRCGQQAVAALEDERAIENQRKGRQFGEEEQRDREERDRRQRRRRGAGRADDGVPERDRTAADEQEREAGGVHRQPGPR